jgi:hypothetical protein
MMLMESRYGISSFVYRARRPFNPRRLYKLIHDKFVIMEGQIQDQDDDGDEQGEDEDEDEDEEMDDADGATKPSTNGTDESNSTSTHDSDEDKDTDDSSLLSASEEKDDGEDDFSKSIDPKVRRFFV